MPIEIDHLGIAVRSLAEGLQFYEKTLGMPVTHTETVDVEKVSVAMLPDRRFVRCPAYRIAGGRGRRLHDRQIH